MSANLPTTRWRFIIVWILFLGLLGLFWEQQYSNQTLVAPRWSRIMTSQKPASPAPKPATYLISADEITSSIQNKRADKQLAAFNPNQSLQKVARFITLELEDQQSLTIPDNLQDLITSVNPSIPPKVEAVTAFLPTDSSLDTVLTEVSAELIENQNYTQLGVATRAAKLKNQDGTLVVILASPPFAAPATPAVNSAPNATPAEYTGQDLWQAVQNYRRAHNLFPFQQSNELCTVASIRLNEQIELGKLDNHSGFNARAEQFFADHPDWTAINENLASGYETAVAAVEWGWDQSLGHQALIKSTDYHYACAAANHGFAVLITGDKK